MVVYDWHAEVCVVGVVTVVFVVDGSGGDVVIVGLWSLVWASLSSAWRLVMWLLL